MNSRSGGNTERISASSWSIAAASNGMISGVYGTSSSSSWIAIGMWFGCASDHVLIVCRHVLKSEHVVPASTDGMWNTWCPFGFAHTSSSNWRTP